MPLLLRPRPDPLESISDYLWRLAHTNRLSLHHLFTAAGISLAPHRLLDQRQLTSPRIQSALEQLTGLTNYNWARHGWSVHKAHFVSASPHGIQLPEHWLRSSAPICPLCLQEHRMQQRSWSLHLVNACHHHGTCLVTHCHRCNQQLDWLRPGIQLCGCGTDLRRAPYTPASPSAQDLALRTEQLVQMQDSSLAIAAWLDCVSGSINNRIREQDLPWFPLIQHALAFYDHRSGFGGFFHDG